MTFYKFTGVVCMFGSGWGVVGNLLQWKKQHTYTVYTYLTENTTLTFPSQLLPYSITLFFHWRESERQIDRELCVCVGGGCVYILWSFCLHFLLGCLKYRTEFSTLNGCLEIPQVPYIPIPRPEQMT